MLLFTEKKREKNEKYAFKNRHIGSQKTWILISALYSSNLCDPALMN